jgi:outer membrane receptor protein involved in Fe transport
MPSTALDQIEIMTNPSSKYDASGNSGIINIKTKKGKNDGFNGSVTLGASTSLYRPENTWYFYPKSQNSLNFNYKKGKWNFFGNYNPNYFRGANLQVLHRSNFDPNTKEVIGYTDQDIRFKFGNTNHTLKLGADWSVDKKNTVGVVVSGFQFIGRPTPTTNARITDLEGNLLSSMVSHTTNRFALKNLTSNLNWRHVFDSAGKELTADADFSVYQNTTDMLLETVPYNSANQPGDMLLLKGHLPSSIHIYSFKSDYVQPFKKGRFEAGVKSSYVETDNVVDYQFHFDDKWVPDARSNHFIYVENINAAYVNVNRQWGKWTLQGGLRVENTIADGDQVTTKQTFRRDTTNLFPTAFVSYDLDKKNKVTVSYGKRINRPNYQSLNPFIFFADSLTFFRGNPLLRPQYTHNIEFTYAFKSKYIATLAYNNTSDVISQIQKSEGVKMFNTVDNVAKLNNASLSLTVPITVAKWWTANFFSTVYYNHYSGIYNNAPADLKATSFMANMTNTFTINKGLTGEISGFYRHRGLDGFTLLEPIYQMTLAVQKQVLKTKGTLRLNLRDPFAWQQFRGYTRLEGIDMTFHSRPDIRQLTATFTYRFGKTTQQSQPRRRTSGSQDEQNRVGNGG